MSWEDEHGMKWIAHKVRYYPRISLQKLRGCHEQVRIVFKPRFETVKERGKVVPVLN
jgi:hypothetical protein